MQEEVWNGLLRTAQLSTLQLIWNHKITKHLYVWTVGGENPRWHRGSMQTPHTKISAAQCTQIQDLLLFLRQQCCQCACQIRLALKKLMYPINISRNLGKVLFLCVKSQIGDNMYYSSVFHRHRFPFIMLSSVCFSADPGSCKDG